MEAVRIRIAHLILEAHVQKRKAGCRKVPDGEITGTTGKIPSAGSIPAGSF